MIYFQLINFYFPPRESNLPVIVVVLVKKRNIETESTVWSLFYSSQPIRLYISFYVNDERKYRPDNAPYMDTFHAVESIDFAAMEA